MEYFMESELAALRVRAELLESELRAEQAKHAQEYAEWKLALEAAGKRITELEGALAEAIMLEAWHDRM